LSFGVAFSGSLETGSLENSLIYEGGFSVDRRGCLSKGGIKFFPASRDLASLAAWGDIPGSSDEAKLTSLAKQILASTDFIILIDSSTAPIAHDYTPINRYTKEIGEMILSEDGLQLLGGPIAVSPIESVNIYRNRSKLLRPDNPC
jgi:hypothetical protein